MKHFLPGQIDLPQTAEDMSTLARLKSCEPLRGAVPQIPLDIGLFSDDSLQTDLIEMLMDPAE